MENEAEKDLQCQAPVRLDLPPEKPLSSSVAKQEGQHNGELSCVGRLTQPGEGTGFPAFKLSSSLNAF